MLTHLAKNTRTSSSDSKHNPHGMVFVYPGDLVKQVATKKSMLPFSKPFVALSDQPISTKKLSAGSKWANPNVQVHTPGHFVSGLTETLTPTSRPASIRQNDLVVTKM